MDDARTAHVPMTRRALLIAAIVALLPSAAVADERGTRAQHRANRRCAALGRSYERRGLTVREAEKLARRGCQRVGDEWLRDAVYQA